MVHCFCTRNVNKEVSVLDAVAIGKKLINLRGTKSREEVVLANGISVSALVMYELGKRIPRDEIKLSLSKYYGKSVEEIFFADNVHVM